MATIQDLQAQVRGEVITPDHADYDQHRRVYNAMHDRRPAAIVRCLDAADVIASVNHARDSELELAVRGGGHSVPGFGTWDDALVIDLSPMRNVHVDPAKRTARAGGGATWGDLDHATHPFGLATTGGVISTTGVAGLTLGGGIGHLTRGHGFSIDNLVSADVVTADGRQAGIDAAFLAAGDYHHHIGLNTWESAGGTPPGSSTFRVGLRRCGSGIEFPSDEVDHGDVVAVRAIAAGSAFGGLDE